MAGCFVKKYEGEQEQGNRRFTNDYPICGISSLWDQFNTILGLFTGGLGGLFVLGIFTQKANARGPSQEF
ncbi:MAG: hypothetical protein ACOYOO_15535 [Saprospiraceae bacterium]